MVDPRSTPQRIPTMLGVALWLDAEPSRVSNRVRRPLRTQRAQQYDMRRVGSDGRTVTRCVGTRHARTAPHRRCVPCDLHPVRSDACQLGAGVGTVRAGEAGRAREHGCPRVWDRHDFRRAWRRVVPLCAKRQHGRRWTRLKAWCAASACRASRRFRAARRVCLQSERELNPRTGSRRTAAGGWPTWCASRVRAHTRECAWPPRRTGARPGSGLPSSRRPR